ncbi:unnamed protein product [Arctia plantaginis]|uniref:Uncharacterized protein n=1 Tax=Arctia plantaginis TaxID=874455 RepID=A0A8S0ZPR1_ARCPL|nr:unnamed protein product [Arctia plantaginis]
MVPQLTKSHSVTTFLLEEDKRSYKTLHYADGSYWWVHLHIHCEVDKHINVVLEGDKAIALDATSLAETSVLGNTSLSNDEIEEI